MPDKNPSVRDCVALVVRKLERVFEAQPPLSLPPPERFRPCPETPDATDAIAAFKRTLDIVEDCANEWPPDKRAVMTQDSVFRRLRALADRSRHLPWDCRQFRRLLLDWQDALQVLDTGTPTILWHNFEEYSERVAASASSAVGEKPHRVTWQQARKRAESHIARNPFPGVNALMKLVGCSKTTILKAIENSSKLRAAMVEHDERRKSVSTVELKDGTAASARQTREPDPSQKASESTDDILARLREAAGPAERAKLDAMPPDKLRELVATYADDPDAHALDENPRVRRSR